MSATEILCRHFSRMGARLKIADASPRQGEIVRIDVGRDRRGEFFDIRCRDGCLPEVLDIQPVMRHLVLMARHDGVKNKFLLGHDERHWFAAAVPGGSVRDVRTAIHSLRPEEAEGGEVVRQGEWFFVPELAQDFLHCVIYRKEPLSRGAGSKPHICEELVRKAGVAVMVSKQHPAGIKLADYERLITENPRLRGLRWRRMVRDAKVFVRGTVRHPDHKTIRLDGWHRVFLNRERFARHAAQIAFLD